MKKVLEDYNAREVEVDFAKLNEGFSSDEEGDD